MWSLALGGVVLLGYAFGMQTPGNEARDLTPMLDGARTVLDGRSPFISSVTPDGRGARMLYPMPGYLVVTPLAGLADWLARAVWAGLMMGILTWLAVGRWGLHGIAVVFSRPMEVALTLAQWSPWYVIGALSPGWQALAIAKPTLGAIVWCYRPSRWALIGGVVLCGLSFLILPSWYSEWRSQLVGVDWYLPAGAIWRGGGPLLLLAATRWRRPEGRLLLALACIPHNYLWYDQLLLFLVPEKRRELWTLWGLSWFAQLFTTHYFEVYGLIATPRSWEFYRAPMVALLYLPCLVMVLRRPNEGSVPAWLEQRIARFPAMLRRST